MNRTVIVVALVLACAFSCYGMSSELKEAVHECRTKYKIDRGQIIEAIENKKLPETEDGQCFMSCVMEKMGVIKDSKIDLDRALELNKNRFKNPDHLEKANEVAKRCANVQAADSKQCSLSTEFVKCTIKNAVELHLETPKAELL